MNFVNSAQNLHRVQFSYRSVWELKREITLREGVWPTVASCKWKTNLSKLIKLFAFLSGDPAYFNEKVFWITCQSGYSQPPSPHLSRQQEMAGLFCGFMCPTSHPTSPSLPPREVCATSLRSPASGIPSGVDLGLCPRGMAPARPLRRPWERVRLPLPNVVKFC